LESIIRLRGFRRFGETAFARHIHEGFERRAVPFCAAFGVSPIPNLLLAKCDRSVANERSKIKKA